MFFSSSEPGHDTQEHPGLAPGGALLRPAFSASIHTTQSNGPVGLAKLRNPIWLEAKMGINGYRPHLPRIVLSLGAMTPTQVLAAVSSDAADPDPPAEPRDRPEVVPVTAPSQDMPPFPT